MPLIVDKSEKRKNIALACKDLFVNECNFNNISIAKIATTAGIAKGSLYDYFENKEDLIFEIISIMIQTSDVRKKKRLEEASSTKEKFKIFFDFFYSEEDKELREIYKSFVAIALINPNDTIKQFQTKCFLDYSNWALEIAQEGIDNKEIIPNSLIFIKALFDMTEGMFISSIATYAVKDLEHEINDYIDNLFELIRVK